MNSTLDTLWNRIHSAQRQLNQTETQMMREDIAGDDAVEAASNAVWEHVKVGSQQGVDLDNDATCRRG